MASIRHRVREGKLLLADGAWGSNLLAAGLDGKTDCAEHWNLSRPTFIAGLAAAFTTAGAEIVTTNTFGGNRIRLAAFGLENKLCEINQRGVSLARSAVGPDVLLAASMGPTGLKDIGGERGAISRAYGEQARILADAGADFILLETMTSPEEACVALEQVKYVTSLDVVCSFAFVPSTTGNIATWSGACLRTAISAILQSGADMIGANCCPADQTLERIIAALHEHAPNQRLWLKPNAGAFRAQGDQPPYPSPVHHLPLSFDTLATMNVAVLGGCCGTTPAHIRALAAQVAKFSTQGCGRT